MRIKMLGTEFWEPQAFHTIFNSFQLQFWNQKVEGTKVVGGQRDSWQCFPSDGLPALWLERLRETARLQAPERGGEHRHLLNPAEALPLWHTTAPTRPSVLRAAPGGAEYAICAIIAISVASSGTIFLALWTRGRRGARGVGFSLTEGWRGRGLEILFILFSAGFQFSTMDWVPGLSSNRFRFSGKQAKESTSYKRPQVTVRTFFKWCKIRYSMRLRAKVSHSVASPWTISCQAPLPMKFSRQEDWSGLPFPSPGNLPNPKIEPTSPALQADSLPFEPPGEALLWGEIPWKHLSLYFEKPDVPWFNFLILWDDCV